MKKVIILLTLIWGIIADALESIRMLFPGFFIETSGLKVENSSSFTYGLVYGMPVMFGWTLILIWTLFKPVERRWVFLCLIPVIALSSVVNINGFGLGVMDYSKFVPVLMSSVLLLIMAIISYVFCVQIDKPERTL